jgi:hypothetical protein
MTVYFNNTREQQIPLTKHIPIPIDGSQPNATPEIMAGCGCSLVSLDILSVIFCASITYKTAYVSLFCYHYFH